MYVHVAFKLITANSDMYVSQASQHTPPENEPNRLNFS